MAARPVVTAVSMYPLVTPAPRVRIAAYVARAERSGLAMSFQPTLTDQEYRIAAGPGNIPRKVALAGRAALRLGRARRADADAFIVHRLATPTPIPGFEPPRQLDLYDFDDALHVGAVGAGNRRLAAVKQERARWATYVSRARVVVAGNAYLAEAAAPMAQRVEVIPSCVDPGGQTLRRHNDAGPVVVGWIGTPSTAVYLPPVVRAVEEVRSKGHDVVMHIVGATWRQSRPWLTCRQWSLTNEAADLASFDIGVMPLPDDPWTRGKCGYKLLQYHSAGVPSVCSPVGVNADIAAGGGGLTATDRAGWVRALTELVGSADIRRERGLVGRADVEARFSVDVWGPRFVDLLFDLVR